MLKDQLEKQPIISKVKNPNFNNVSFKNLLDDKSMKVFDKIRYQDEIIDCSQLNLIGSSKKSTFKFEDFMSLGNLAENIYNGNISLDAWKQEQRKMENILKSFINYSPIKDMYKRTKDNFIKNEEEFILLLKKINFHYLNHMCLVKMNGKKNNLSQKLLS